MAKYNRHRRANYNQNDGIAGVVYILENHGLREDFYKIGCSRHSGAKRAQDLNSDANTGTPGTFECIFEYRTKDCGVAEKKVFKLLNEFRRGKQGQEFFQLNKGQFESAKESIKEVCKKVDSEIYEKEHIEKLRAVENPRLNSGIPISNVRPEITRTQQVSSQYANVNRGILTEKKESNTSSTFFKVGVCVFLIFLYEGIFTKESTLDPDKSSNSSTSIYSNQIAKTTNQASNTSNFKNVKEEVTENLTDVNSPVDSPRHQFDDFGKEIEYKLESATEAKIQEATNDNLETYNNPPDELTSFLSAKMASNLKTCLEGKYPTLCKHGLLNEDEFAQVLNAEKVANLKTCLDGRYSSICNHDLLNEYESAQVLNAEKAANLKICLNGKYSSVCKHELLNEDESAQVLNAEKAANLKICLNGRYPTICKYDLLNDDELTLVVNAEKAANLKTCLDGKYPALCKHELLSSDEISVITDRK